MFPGNFWKMQFQDSLTVHKSQKKKRYKTLDVSCHFFLKLPKCDNSQIIEFKYKMKYVKINTSSYKQ